MSQLEVIRYMYLMNFSRSTRVDPSNMDCTDFASGHKQKSVHFGIFACHFASRGGVKNSFPMADLSEQRKVRQRTGFVRRPFRLDSNHWPLRRARKSLSSEVLMTAFFLVVPWPPFQESRAVRMTELLQCWVLTADLR